MAITLVGKIVITVLTLAVAAGLTTVIVFVVNDANEHDSPPDDSGSSTTAGPILNPGYQVGVGIADITGPCVEIAFMGYAEVSQTGTGIHTRQFARSFIFVQGDTRVVLVTADLQSVGIAVRREVVKNLQLKYGQMYNLRNVIITGTHTHSTPGGYLVDFLLDVSILGFSSESFNAYVQGITRSIERAHENIVPARLFYGQTKVTNAHMNRSPYSYEYNPQTERDRYDANTDDMLTQVRIVKEDGSLHGVMSWYAIHTTTMNMTNQLVSSDNLGYAAIRMEQELNPGTLAGKPKIVAGFFSSNLGDVSPNTRGARCEFSGRECDNHFKLCGFQERCFSQGPGEDMFESVKIIGNMVFEGAWQVLNSPGEELTGRLAVLHEFVNMPEEEVSKYDPVTRTFNDTEQVHGCVASMGYSFASGTIDGANTLNITQGTIEGNPLLDMVSGVIAGPTDEDIDCHAPKPILLATGRANFPLPWHPSIVSVSLIWLGDLVILGVPGEATTMAGRRMKDVVGSVMERNGFEPRVVVSGLTNEYIHYVSTYEEYQVQRYEAASTIYGPHTLDILLNKFNNFTNTVIEGGTVPEGPEPADNRGRTLSLILPVVMDVSQLGREFGQTIRQPVANVTRGETVFATFMAANPRNDLKQEASHAVIERLDGDQWVVVANDADLNTRFIWERLSTITGTSRARFEWTVPLDAVSGVPHRIKYYGTARGLLGRMTEFTGESNSFTIVDVQDDDETNTM
ncbi:neutral ceramidase-like [Anticarsia gemmatalis]|uniref:neutral ceramidase-like n=1 Tax=Anticarsia gemmatalis TaxID=129554 RepID=UPI003F76309F